MTLTLHFSQVRYSGVMQRQASSSRMPTPLPAESQRQVAKLTSELFHCWSLLCIDSILQMFTLRYGSRRVEMKHEWICSNFILCEKKYEWIYSKPWISLKNLLLVWDCECDQCAWMNNLIQGWQLAALEPNMAWRSIQQNRQIRKFLQRSLKLEPILASTYTF